MNEVIRSAYGSRLKSGFIPFGRLYRSEVGVSLVLADVVPKVATLWSDVRKIFKNDVAPDRRVKTPFMEVGIVPFEEAMPDDVLELVKNPPAQAETFSEDEYQKMFQVFVGIVEKSWDPKKFHLVYHSSGHDSRWISWAIKTLYEKNGPDWLGDILFVEFFCESEPFKQIMEAEGWADSQWAIYNPEATNTGEYHARSLVFKDAWERLGGCSPMPLAFWSDPVEYFQRQGAIPSDNQLQCWTGLFANEFSRWTGPCGFEAAVHIVLGSHYHTQRQKGEFVLPFLNLEWIAAKLRSSDRIVRHHDQMVEAVAPQLTPIPRVLSRTQKQSSCALVSKRLRKQFEKDFNNSWYGRNVCPGMRCHAWIRFKTSWGRWNCASLCEHLIEQGHTIKLEKM